MKRNTLIVISAVVAALALLLIAGVVVGGCGLLWLGASRQVVKESREEAAAIPRDEFRKRATGKTPEQMIEEFGRPDSTTERATGDYWYYRRRTVDPVTGKVDAHIQVIFKNGRVHEMNF